MAVAGLLIMGKDVDMDALEATLNAQPGLTLYGRAREVFAVAVLEEPSVSLKKRLEDIEKLPGVLSVLATSVSIEDESPGAVMPRGSEIA